MGIIKCYHWKLLTQLFVICVIERAFITHLYTGGIPPLVIKIQLHKKHSNSFLNNIFQHAIANTAQNMEDALHISQRDTRADRWRTAPALWPRHSQIVLLFLEVSMMLKVALLSGNSFRCWGMCRRCIVPLLFFPADVAHVNS